MDGYHPGVRAAGRRFPRAIPAHQQLRGRGGRVRPRHPAARAAVPWNDRRRSRGNGTPLGRATPRGRRQHDIRDLTRGSTLRLPVRVPGALFSVGDTHAAQGDGEVCGTAVESPMVVTLKFTVQKRANLRRPQFTVPSAPTRHVDERGYHVTTGIAPDLMQAARDAVRDAIDYLGKEYRLNPDLAYAVCSVAADLRISEVVDVPNWVVSAYLPKAIFA